MGSHVSVIPNHQVFRKTPLHTRANVAYFGTFGYELDLNSLKEEEIAEVKEQIIFMKKYRKSIWLPVALLVYTTAMAVCFIPRNTEISDTEKYLTVGLSYMIIALLWIVLRKKEKAEERRERDLENKK